MDIKLFPLTLRVLLALQVGACTSYEVIRTRELNPQTPDAEIWYLKRWTGFLFFGSEDILRCYETRTSDTKCVVLAINEVDSTPCLTTSCAAGRSNTDINPRESPRSNAEPPTNSPNTKQLPSGSIVLEGRGLFQLPAPVTTRLRQLVGQRVVLRTIYGKDFTGTLSDLSAEDGLLLTRETSVVKYPWVDVHAVWTEVQ